MFEARGFTDAFGKTLILEEHEYFIDKLVPVGITLQPQDKAIVLESLLKQNKLK